MENVKRDGNFYYTVLPDGTASIQGAEDWPEVLIIPETVGGLTVTEIGVGAFDADEVAQKLLLTDGPVPIEQLSAKITDIEIELKVKERLKEVHLPETIKRIKVGAFFENMYLAHINFPAGLEIIEEQAFCNVACDRFIIPKTTIIEKESPEDEIWDDNAAFEGCEGAAFIFI